MKKVDIIITVALIFALIVALSFMLACPSENDDEYFKVVHADIGAICESRLGLPECTLPPFVVNYKINAIEENGYTLDCVEEDFEGKIDAYLAANKSAIFAALDEAATANALSELKKRCNFESLYDAGTMELRGNTVILTSNTGKGTVFLQGTIRPKRHYFEVKEGSAESDLWRSIINSSGGIWYIFYGELQAIN